MRLSSRVLDALTEQAATEAPTLADVAPLLGALPVLADGLHTAPQRELRILFDQLNLDISYQPAERALDVAIMLYDGRDDQSPQTDLRRSNPVHPAIHNANLSGALVLGEPLALPGRHAKVRRTGYQAARPEVAGKRSVMTAAPSATPL